MNSYPDQGRYRNGYKFAKCVACILTFLVIPVVFAVTTDKEKLPPVDLRSPVPEVPASLYTDFVKAQLQKLAGGNASFFNQIPEGAGPAPKVQVYGTADRPLYVGVAQNMSIHAGLASVEKQLDAFGDYPKWIPDLRSVKFTKLATDIFLTSWSEKVPVLFANDEHYDLLYWTDKSHENYRSYRYQLKSGSSLRFSDGLVWIVKNVQGDVDFYELDLFEADWGLLGKLSADAIWRGCLKNVVISDLNLKFKSENPAWSDTRVQEASTAAVHMEDLDKLVAQRKTHALVP